MYQLGALSSAKREMTNRNIREVPGVVPLGVIRPLSLLNDRHDDELLRIRQGTGVASGPLLRVEGWVDEEGHEPD